MITVLNDSTIAIEVPEDSRKHSITDSPDPGSYCLAFEIVPMDDAPSWDISENLPPGQWEILGRPLLITEEQWRGIVEVFKYIEIDKLYPSQSFRNYNRVNAGSAAGFNNATESGMSLLKSKSLDPLNIIILKKKSK